MEATMLKVDEIRVNPNRREMDDWAVELLAESIEEIGLVNPIVVDTEHTLIAGLHRLEAVKSLGWEEIPCTVKNLTGLQAELAEIDENYVRNPLSARETSKVMYRRKQIYEELHPETKNGGDRRSEQTRNASCISDSEPAKPFAQETAERFGMSRRTVERLARIGEKVTPEAMAVFDDDEDKFTQKEGLLLSHIAPEHQEEAARQYVAGEIRSIGDYKPDRTDGSASPDSGNESDRDCEDADEDHVDAPSDPKEREKWKRDLAASYHDPVLGKIVADLKDRYLDRSTTAEVFLREFARAGQSLIDQVDGFNLQEYQDLFPTLTEDHYQGLLETKQRVESCLDTFLNGVKEKMRT